MMKTYTYYRGTYRHVAYEIVSWQLPDGNTAWCAYILTNSEQVKLTYIIAPLGNGIVYHHYDDPVLSALDVPGGITLYEVTTHPGNDITSYRIGWDYQHIWNEGRYYDADTICADVKHVINDLWLAATDMKVWCATVGGWHSLSDGYITRDGEFISNAGIAWRKESGYPELEIEAQS